MKEKQKLNLSSHLINTIKIRKQGKDKKRKAEAEVKKNFMNMETNKFLNTNMEEYFDSDEHKCFSC